MNMKALVSSSSSSMNEQLASSRKLARKYKAMNLPVQRLNAVRDAIFWRKFMQ